MQNFLIAADVRHVAGSLAGIVSPSGFQVKTTDPIVADKIMQWIDRAFATGEFIGIDKKRKFASVARISAL